ncbi:MAG: acylphosphatase [Gaiellaceae bacterium]
MLIRRRLVVHGVVQGVGFRAFVWRAASQRGVAGWARNRPDGTVEVVLEGKPDAVEALVRACREGPRGAAVTEVELFKDAPEGLSAFGAG